PGTLVEIVAEQLHRKTAELYRNVRAGRDVSDRRLPFLEDVVATVGKAADPNRAAAVIEHNLCIGERAGKAGEFADLRMEQPRIEGEAERREAGKALAEGRVEQQSLWPRGVHAGDSGVAIPRGRMPDAAKAAVAGGDFRLQHRLCA